MKIMNKMLTVATAVVIVAASSVANAQLVRPGAGAGAGIGSGIGSRLGIRNNNNNQPGAATPTPATQAAPAAQGTTTQTAPATATPGVTRALPQTTTPATATPAASAAQTPQAAAGATAQSATAVTKSDGSEFKIPANATPEQLVAQATSLLSTEIAFETEEEYSTWVATMLQTVGRIGDRILTLKPDDKYFIEAISLKGQVLCYQASLDSSVLPKLKQYADALAKNERVQGLEDGRNATLAFTGVYLQAVVADIAEREGTAAELVKAMNDVNAFIKANPQASDMAVDLVLPVKYVAETLGDDTLPTKIWAPIRQTLAASDAPESQNALVMLDGTIRFVDLVGSEFEWKGCDAAGKPLDQTKVKGRVVVVDFWASWAEQSLETHKQLLELYNKYHKQGFEIISYNLDPTLEDMQEYLKTNKLPWIVLSDRATVDAKETSLAGYYGISEIPLLILVGGDGKTASTDITMESLAATLESVFSPDAVQTQTSGVPAATGTAAGTTTATGAGATTPRAATGATTTSGAGANAPRATTGTATGTRTTTPSATGAAPGGTRTTPRGTTTLSGSASRTPTR